MPRATPENTTPEPRETRYIRATTPVAVELHQPVAPGQVRTIMGRLLGEMRVNGCVHHYRIVDGNGVIFITPTEWLTPESVQAIDAARNAKRLAIQDNITRLLSDLVVSLAARATKPEIRLRAEKRVGQLLKVMDKAEGAREVGVGRRGTRSDELTTLPQQTLADIGITKNQSSQWQKLADVDEEFFEQAVKADRPTTSGIIAASTPSFRIPPSESAVRAEVLA